MAQHRHATPIKEPSSPSLFSKLGLHVASLKPTSLKIGRTQTAVLTLAACSLALGLGVPSLNSGQSAAYGTTVASASHSTNRTVIELALPAQDIAANAETAAKQTAAAINNIEDNTETNTEITALLATASRAQQSTDLAHTPYSLEDQLHTVLPEPKPANKRVTETIKRGDNLSMVFARVGLSGKDVYQVVQSGSEGKALTRMFPGEALEFVLDGDNRLQKIIRIKSPLESVYFVRQQNTDNPRYDINTITREPQIKTTYRSAYINNSLSLSAQQADVSQNITMNMANIFGGVIDFVLDVRNGDQFTVIYEEQFLDGEKIKEGNIIAAQYVNRDKVYNAYRYTDPKGDTGYYNEEGVSMRKAFLRAPVDFTRISSGFNLRRLHPITKQVRPHRGIDYAAPTGTPVFSVGEGRVVASGRSKANGNYVFIKHGESYTTKYLHLHKRNVSKGQRVKQGQIIGQVGCTGLCTGPHLHYEFLVSGVHRNPRTIMQKLPKAKKLDDALIDDFHASIGKTQLALANYSSQIKLARAQ